MADWRISKSVPGRPVIGIGLKRGLELRRSLGEEMQWNQEVRELGVSWALARRRVLDVRDATRQE